MKKTKIIAASMVLITPSYPSKRRITDAPSTMGMSIHTVERATLRVVMTAERPKITRMFMMLLPNMLPMVMSALPAKAACRLGGACAHGNHSETDDELGYAELGGD